MDYSNMKATKVKRESATSSISVSKKTRGKAKRGLTKLGISYIVIFIFLVIGIAGGFLISKYAFSGDTFEMVAFEDGLIDVYIGQGESKTSYTEPGAKCVAFGKDASNSITIEYYYRNDLTQEPQRVESVDSQTEGIYYAIYTSNNIKFKSVRLIRNIIVLRSEDNG